MEIQPSNEDYSPRFVSNEKDDRLDWPRRFFSFECRCHGNYHGYMCHECKYEYQGDSCQDKHVVTRKNALTLNVTEKKQFVNALLKARSTPSEFVVQSDISSTHVHTVSYLETRHPVILDGYLTIWTGFGRAGSL